MTRLEARIAEHPVVEAVSSLQVELAGLSDEVRSEVDQAGREDLMNRASDVSNYVSGLLEAADPHLVSTAALDTLNGHFEQAVAAVRSLEPDPAGQSAQLEQAIEAVLQAAPPLAAAAAGFAKSTQRMGRKSGALTKRLKTLGGEADMMKEELAELESRSKTALEELGADEAAKRSELDSGLQELRAGIDSERERLGAIGEEANQRFEEAERARGEAFDSAVEHQESRAAGALQRTESVAERVEELYGVVTDAATAGEFKREADRERKAADDWRLVAMSFGIGAAVIGIASVVVAALTTPTAGTIVAKLVATAAFAGIATYAARQSGQHRKRSNDLRDLALELVTFEGAIHGLDEPQQKDLRGDFIQRAFRGRSGGEQNALPDQSEAFGLTPDALSAIAALAKALQNGSR